MTFLLNLIPAPYRVLAEILIITALVGAMLGALHAYGERRFAAGEASTQAKWNAERAKQLTAALAEAEANAKETQRRLEAQGDAQREHDEELAAYQNTVAAADAAAGSMRKRIADLAAAARRGTGDSATVGERQAAGAAAGMLADLSGRTDAAADLYARVADARRRAGLQCERDYDALKAVKAKPL